MSDIFHFNSGQKNDESRDDVYYICRMKKKAKYISGLDVIWVGSNYDWYEVYGIAISFDVLIHDSLDGECYFMVGLN